jgi:hypothetical protein
MPYKTSQRPSPPRRPWPFWIREVLGRQLSRFFFQAAAPVATVIGIVAYGYSLCDLARPTPGSDGKPVWHIGDVLFNVLSGALLVFMLHARGRRGERRSLRTALSSSQRAIEQGTSEFISLRQRIDTLHKGLDDARHSIGTVSSSLQLRQLANERLKELEEAIASLFDRSPFLGDIARTHLLERIQYRIGSITRNEVYPVYALEITPPPQQLADEFRLLMQEAFRNSLHFFTVTNPVFWHSRCLGSTDLLSLNETFLDEGKRISRVLLLPHRLEVKALLAADPLVKERLSRPKEMIHHCRDIPDILRIQLSLWRPDRDFELCILEVPIETYEGIFRQLQPATCHDARNFALWQPCADPSQPSTRCLAASYEANSCADGIGRILYFDGALTVHGKKDVKGKPLTCAEALLRRFREERTTSLVASQAVDRERDAGSLLEVARLTLGQREKARDHAQAYLDYLKGLQWPTSPKTSAADSSSLPATSARITPTSPSDASGGLG